MESFNYVLNHKFGYNSEPELRDLFKLELRNLNDLYVYLKDCINDIFVNDNINNYTQYIKIELK